MSLVSHSLCTEVGVIVAEGEPSVCDMAHFYIYFFTTCLRCHYIWAVSAGTVSAGAGRCSCGNARATQPVTMSDKPARSAVLTMLVPAIPAHADPQISRSAAIDIYALKTRPR